MKSVSLACCERDRVVKWASTASVPIDMPNWSLSILVASHTKSVGEGEK